MKILKNIFFLFLLIPFYSFAQTADTNYLYEENFDGNKTWTQSSNSTRELKTYNGRYYFEHKRTTDSWQITTTTINLDSSKDFDIETSIQKISGVQDSPISFKYDYKDDNNYKEFAIAGTGFYRVAESVNGTYSLIKSWTKSDKVKKGNYGVNKLKVSKKASSVSFYINGSKVHSIPHKAFLGKKIAFALYKNQKISIDYIRVKASASSSKKIDSKSKTILFEGFNNNNNNWSTSNSNDISFEIKNGDYFIDHKRETGGYTSTIIKTVDASKDFNIIGQFKKINGITNNGFGLTFGRKDSQNQNEFFITSGGSFMIKKTENGTSTNLKNWTVSSHIKKGNNAVNYLKVEKKGNSIKYYINSNLVHTSYSYKFYGNRIGFIVYNKQKISIGYLSMSYLGNSTAPKPKPIAKGNLVFSDDFNDNTNRWHTASNQDLDFSFSGGKFNLDYKLEKGGRLTYINKYFNSSKDFEIETKLQHVSGDTNSPYGILWGKKDENYLQFLLTATGYYKIKRVVNNKNEEIIKWVKSSLINKGSGQSNTIKIKREGDYYKFYINNSYATKVDFEAFYGSEIGYGVYFKQKVAVDYLKIRTPKKSNYPIYTNKTLQLPFYDNFNYNTNKWGLENASDYAVDLKIGHLILHRKKKGGSFVGKNVDINTSKDFIIETSISQKSITSSGMYGITFGRKNSSNEYSFLLSSNGSYKFRKFENDVHKEIIPLTSSSSIQIDTEKPNKIKIVKSGNLMRFYINGSYVNETPFQAFYGNKFGYTIYYDKKIAVDYLDIKYQTASYNNPPVVQIFEPNVSLSRGFKIVATKRIMVKGKATDADGIYEININGVEASVDDNGNFSASVPLKYGKNDLVVKATDLKQASSTKKFTIKRKSIVTPNPNPDPDPDPVLDIGFGKYYALIIGVSSYTDKTIPDLKGEPLKDAQALADVLTSKYSFARQNVTVLKNPTENQINREFVKLGRKIGRNDNLVIFYAGHGNYDKVTEKGYWMPSNANMDFEENIILNTSIVSYIKAIKSKHTLLISDACFSGSILTASRSYKTASKAVQKKYALPSRKAITSGTLTTVPNKSVFMKYLLKRLNQNSERYLAAGQLFNMIEDPVINNTTGDNQPQYAPISRTGDEGGDFIFIKRN